MYDSHLSNCHSDMPPDESHVLLKEFIEVQLKAHDRLNDTRFTSIERAVEVASAQMDKRLDGMNEFRNTLKDQASKFITRDEFLASHDKNLSDIRELRESRAELAGKASQKDLNMTRIVSFLGLVIAIVSLVIELTK